MNIAIVTTWFPSGAGYVSRAYKEVLEKDFNVFIYARGGKNMRGSEMWDNSNVAWAPTNTYGEINEKHFFSWLKKKSISIIFFNEQRFWQPVFKAKELGYLIGAYIDYYTEETVPLFSIYDFLICNTKRHKSVFDWHPNCIFIPWGTYVNLFKSNDRPPKRKLTFIMSLGWECKHGKLDRKGFYFAIEAFKKVKGDCVLKVYSQVELECCISKWKDLIKTDPRIEFIFGTFDPFPFNEGDVYIYPSRLDGIGLSLPEALSSGLAAITTDNAPMNEFVENDYNGKLIKVNKYVSRYDGYYWPQSLVSVDHLSKLIDYYVTNPSLAFEHGKNARKKALSELDWIENSKNLNKQLRFIFSAKRINSLSVELKYLSVLLDRRNYPSIKYRLFSAIKDYLFKIGIKISFTNYFKKTA